MREETPSRQAHLVACLGTKRSFLSGTLGRFISEQRNGTPSIGARWPLVDGISAVFRARSASFCINEPAHPDRPTDLALLSVIFLSFGFHVGWPW